jgi:hypothetical protein
VDHIQADFESIIAKIDSDDAAAQDILRVAIAYYKLSLNSELSSLSLAIGNKNQNLKNIVDLLSTGSGKIDYKNLGGSLNIDQMKTLLDKYKNQFLDK